MSDTPTIDPKAQREAAIKLATELNAKTQARIEVLKTFEGKDFRRKDGMNPHQTIRIVRYEGIAKLAGGDLAHLFRVESKNPGAIWTPPATAFLEEHEQIEASKEAIKNQEVI